LFAVAAPLNVASEPYDLSTGIESRSISFENPNGAPGAGGKAELNPEKYHIPMIFYAPDFIKPSRYEKIASQIDMAPILLGMMNFSYQTKFLGSNLLNYNDENPHAFISNYQKIALIKNDQLTVLAPKRKIEQYSWPAIEPLENGRNVEDAIAYYQYSSWWRDQFRRIPTVVEK
jgi:arylsulfatase A-like enzyme